MQRAVLFPAWTWAPALVPLPPLSYTDCSRELRVCRLPFVQMICCISVT